MTTETTTTPEDSNPALLPALEDAINYWAYGVASIRDTLDDRMQYGEEDEIIADGLRAEAYCELSQVLLNYALQKTAGVLPELTARVARMKLETSELAVDLDAAQEIARIKVHAAKRKASLAQRTGSGDE